MPRHRVAVSAHVRAPAAQLYATLADYRLRHPAILPPAYFRNLAVERGGVGEGTRFRVRMQLLGATRTLRALVTEPEPGRVLVETDLDTGAVTTFTVAASADGSGATVTIATELPVAGSLLGLVERVLATRLLRRIYRQELELLAELHATYGAELEAEPGAAHQPTSRAWDGARLPAETKLAG